MTQKWCHKEGEERGTHFIVNRFMPLGEEESIWEKNDENPLLKMLET